MAAHELPKISRREAIKTLGAGVAVVGLGAISINAMAAESAGSPAAAIQPFSLPPLGYSYDALEPHIDARTMEIHYTKHHQAYVTNANKALADHAALQAKSGEELLKDLSVVPESIRGAVRNNVGGHVNHSFFWPLLAPGGAGEPDAAVSSALAKAFGSMDAFKTQFADAAMKRFGSGWAWLSVKDGVLKIHSTANQDSPVSEGAKPVVGLDVWEHAYYLHYQNRRAEYVAAFWKILNWQQVAKNLQAASAA
jgi:Fe-Mn family superoxide dismutase